MKQKPLLFCLLVMFILLSVDMLPASKAIAQNGSINVPYSTNVPNIDGVWTTPTEWSDASETLVQNQANQSVYMRMKQNQDYIFILMDFISDTNSLESYYCIACLDTKDTGGNFFSTIDYGFAFAQGGLGGIESFQGSNAGSWAAIPNPVDLAIAPGFSSMHDPYNSTANHHIFEFQIPCSLLGASFSYGIYLSVSGGGALVQWPQNAGGVEFSWNGNNYVDGVPAPGNWGEITSTTQFARTPLPSPSPSPTETVTSSPIQTSTPTPTVTPQVAEFPVLAIVPILLATGLSIAMLNRKKHQRIHRD